MWKLKICQSFADVGDKQKKQKNLRCQNLANHVFFSLRLPPLLLFSLPLITHHLSLAIVGVEKKNTKGDKMATAEKTQTIS